MGRIAVTGFNEGSRFLNQLDYDIMSTDEVFRESSGMSSRSASSNESLPTSLISTSLITTSSVTTSLPMPAEMTKIPAKVFRSISIASIPIPNYGVGTATPSSTLVPTLWTDSSNFGPRTFRLQSISSAGNFSRHGSTSSDRSDSDAPPKAKVNNNNNNNNNNSNVNTNYNNVNNNNVNNSNTAINNYNTSKPFSPKQQFRDWENKFRGDDWSAWKQKLEYEIGDDSKQRTLNSVKQGNSSPWTKFALLAYLHSLLDKKYTTVPTDIHFKGCLVIVEGKERYNAQSVQEEIVRIKNTISVQELELVYQDPMPRLTFETIQDPIYMMDFRARFRINPTTTIDRNHLRARFGQYRIQKGNQAAIKVSPPTGILQL